MVHTCDFSSPGTGNCVTTIEGDDVCGLDSQSTGCSEENNLATINCQCYPGVVSEDCEGKVVNEVWMHACMGSGKRGEGEEVGEKRGCGKEVGERGDGEGGRRKAGRPANSHYIIGSCRIEQAT